MITIFRRIRQKLIDSGSVTKYLLYATGEILLVVIGILIALQINNWNESRVEQDLAMEYLGGIRSDLLKDVAQIDRILPDYSQSVSLIHSVDPFLDNFPVFEVDKYKELFISPDTIDIPILFYRGVSFRSFRGSYNALISDGKTGIIDNRKLFEEIQEIYDERHLRISSTYESVKTREQHIFTQYPFEKRDWVYSDMVAAKDQKVFLDLSNFTEMKFIYAQDLIDLREKINETIPLLDRELGL